MPEKTSTSSPSSPRRSSEPGGGRAARLLCPADLPGLEFCLARNSSEIQPRHVHDSLVVGVVTAGVRRIETARGRTLVLQGEVFAIAPGMAHACAPEGGPCSYVAFSIKGEALPGADADALPLRQNAPELARDLLRLAECCEVSASALERQSLLACALERLFDAPFGGTPFGGTPSNGGPSGARPHAPNAGGSGPERLADAVLRAKALLTEEPERDMSLPELAAACGADMYALHRAFTRLVGLPPHAFQTHLRLRRAKELLRAGETPTDAALAAGFCDQSHMHRHFTRLVGFTPALYASAHKARRA